MKKVDLSYGEPMTTIKYYLFPAKNTTGENCEYLDYLALFRMVLTMRMESFDLFFEMCYFEAKKKQRKLLGSHDRAGSGRERSRLLRQ